MPFTEDLSLRGTYDVTVVKKFAQPKDYKKTKFDKIKTEFTFQVEMIDPCFSSMMMPFTI